MEFGLILPALLALSVGILEFTFLMFDFARASEATRRGARIAAISHPVGNLDSLTTADVRCTSSGGTVSCIGVAVADGPTFDRVAAEMQEIYSAIAPHNIQITYSASGVGLAEAGGYKPYVQVRLIGLQRPFLALQSVTGMGPTITMPPFATTLLGNSYQSGGT